MGTPFRVRVLYALVAGCGTDPTPAETTPDFSCEAIPDPHCAHPIDRLVIPKLRALGVPIRDAEPEEVCRRLAIDLLGRAPSQAELAVCRGQTPALMFDTFVVKPAYGREQRRAWGELFAYNNSNVWTNEEVDLDRLVGEVYDGTIDYAEFATQVAVHPALVALHPDDSWTTYLWNLFLGRPARQDEIEAMRPITLAWARRALCDRNVWWNFYLRALAAGMNETEAINEGTMACYNVAKVEWGFNLCACSPGFFSRGCVSDVLGKRVEITAVCPVPLMTNDPANFMRATMRTPGVNQGRCPNGSMRTECTDRILDYAAQYTFRPFFEWNPPTSQLQAELRAVGDALIARGDFWETAADRELHKLLGWWQTTFRHPDSDLPEVRSLLADQLKASGDLRDVQRLVATSLLYVQPGTTPDVDGAADMPPWIAGPTKLLAGEAWLVTAADSVGEVAGQCDFRWVSTGYFAPHWTDPNFVIQPTGTLDALTFDGYSIASIVGLSGCNSDVKRPDVSNIGLTFNQADIARTLCSHGSGVTPTGWTDDYPAAARHLIEHLWHRTPRPGEAEAMATEMTGCIGAGMTTGCGDHDAAARWLCQRMLDSAEFATY